MSTRKPEAVKRIQGTSRPDRTNVNEPQYDVVAPVKPDHITADPIASAEWDRTVAEMVAKGTIADVYHGVLEGYCFAYRDMIHHESDYQNTSLRDRREARTDVRQFSNILGLNPSAVGKVTAAPTATKQSALSRIQEMGRGLRAVRKTV